MASLYATAGQGNRLKWPAPQLAERWDEIRVYDWLTSNHESMIENEALSQAWGVNRIVGNDYIPVPLAAKLVSTAASLLFGQAPVIKWDNETDNDRGAEIFEENGLQAKLREAAEMASGEGGVFWRVYLNDATPRGQKVPLFSFHSELECIPTFQNGDELTECIWVKTYDISKGRRYRLLEIHAPGTITWRLMRADSVNELGDPVPFDLEIAPNMTPGRDIMAGFPEAQLSQDGTTLTYRTGTEGLWMGYIPNVRTGKSPYGVSDLDGLVPMLLATNEAVSATHNAMKHAEPLILADERLLDKNGRLSNDYRVYSLKVRDAQLGQAPFFEAKTIDVNIDGFVLWQNTLVSLTASLNGIDPSLIHPDLKGSSLPESGRAMRQRNIRSLIEQTGKKHFWTTEVQKMLMVAAQIDQAEGKGQWSDPTAKPSIQIQVGFPPDPQDVADEVTLLVGQGLMSKERAVRKLMTAEGATEEEIQAEIDRLNQEADQQAVQSTGSFKALFDRALTDNSAKNQGGEPANPNQAAADNLPPKGQ